MQQPAPDELDVFVRLQAGDEAARRMFVARAYKRLKRLTRKVFRGFKGSLRHLESTTDALHIALVEFMARMKKTPINDPLHFFRLMARVVRNHLRKATKRERRHGRVTVSRLVAHSESPSEALYRIEVHEKIAELPELYRDVIELRVYCGLSRREAAKLLNRCERDVGRLYQRARILLAERLGLVFVRRRHHV